MAIFSACSDLETRELRWVPRKTEFAPQQTFAGQICAHEAWFFAAAYRDRYADEVKDVTID